MEAVLGLLHQVDGRALQLGEDRECEVVEEPFAHLVTENLGPVDERDHQNFDASVEGPQPEGPDGREQLRHLLRDRREALDASVAKSVVEPRDVASTALEQERLAMGNEGAWHAELVCVQAQELNALLAVGDSHAQGCSQSRIRPCEIMLVQSLICAHANLQSGHSGMMDTQVGIVAEPGKRVELTVGAGGEEVVDETQQRALPAVVRPDEGVQGRQGALHVLQARVPLHVQLRQKPRHRRERSASSPGCPYAHLRTIGKGEHGTRSRVAGRRSRRASSCSGNEESRSGVGRTRSPDAGSRPGHGRSRSRVGRTRSPNGGSCPGNDGSRSRALLDAITRRPIASG